MTDERGADDGLDDTAADVTVPGDEPTYVVATVRGERIEIAESVLDELVDLADEDGLTAEAWVEQNLGPSILYGAVIGVVDAFDFEEPPSATTVAAWREELADSREAAEEVWNEPTLEYSDQVWESAVRLEHLLETVETSLTSLEIAREKHGADHELVEELSANVDEQVDLLRRIAESMRG